MKAAPCYKASSSAADVASISLQATNRNLRVNERPSISVIENSSDYGKAICTSIPGAGINTIIAKVLLEKVTPVAVDAAISIQREIVKRTEQVDRLLQLHVERAQYEANLARKRVMSVDPGNRLVAQTFEQEWNEKLTLLAQAKHDYESRRKTHQNVLEPARQAKIKQFVADFATVWSHQATTFQDKKRMIRLLIEDVTLKREGHEVDVYNPL